MSNNIINCDNQACIYNTSNDPKSTPNRCKLNYIDILILSAGQPTCFSAKYNQKKPKGDNHEQP